MMPNPISPKPRPKAIVMLVGLAGTCVATRHRPPVHVWPVGQFPQAGWSPQSSRKVPHCTPWDAHVLVGVQHARVLGLHSSDPGQVPQLMTVDPQSFSQKPHAAPKLVHVSHDVATVKSGTGVGPTVVNGSNAALSPPPNLSVGVGVAATPQ
jgi:hypothetical protein